jgi:hypothetical protein
MEKIAANAKTRGDLTKGAVGCGESVMAGLLRCGRCDHRLRARYPFRGVRYFCAGGKQQRQNGVTPCLNFHGVDLEMALADEILDVVGPAGVEAAQRAAKQLASQQQRQLIVGRLQAMREEETRAAREYKQTDVTYAAVRQTLGAEGKPPRHASLKGNRDWQRLTSDNRCCLLVHNKSNWRASVTMRRDCGITLVLLEL